MIIRDILSTIKCIMLSLTSMNVRFLTVVNDDTKAIPGAPGFESPFPHLQR